MGNIFWRNGVTGDWSNPGNWEGGGVPAVTDDAVIQLGVRYGYTVNISTAESCRSLTVSDNHFAIVDDTGVLSLSAGLTLGSPTEIGGYFLMHAGGTIQGGTITARHGGLYSQSLFADGSVDQTLNSGGILDGVTYHGFLDLRSSWTALSIFDGITFAAWSGTGRAQVYFDGGNNQSSIVKVRGKTTLDNAVIYIGHDGTNGTNTLQNFDQNGHGVVLTLGRHLTINQIVTAHP